MEKVIHKAEDRGHANHGWLDAHHSFSFANYYNPERTRFGVLPRSCDCGSRRY